MKSNFIGALVILFITIAFLFVIYDLSKDEHLPAHASVQNVNQHHGLVSRDSE